jgi:S-adenosylmethionine hydrolase
LIRRPGLRRPSTVFFLSDYGAADEFVGVVHAVVARHAPSTRVIDLAHGVPTFDVAAGAATLERAVDHLGDGVVLAVVDPGVGGSRRAIAFQVAAARGPRWFVGPDNGLLMPAADRRGGVRAAIELVRGDVPSTFDGRDLLAPAAAALSRGVRLTSLGPAVDSQGLERLAPPVLLLESVDSGSSGRIVAVVTWIDRFGNVQLAARPSDLAAAPTGSLQLRVGDASGPPPAIAAQPVRRVGAFVDLAADELGLLVDANGHLAVVLREASAGERLGVSVGARIELAWGP